LQPAGSLQPWVLKPEKVERLGKVAFPVKQTLELVAQVSLEEPMQTPTKPKEHLLQLRESTSMKDAMAAMIPIRILPILVCWLVLGCG